MQIQTDTIYKENLLKELLKIDPHWVDGDLDKKFANISSADLVNNELKVRIELKEWRTLCISTYKKDPIKKIDKKIGDSSRKAMRKFNSYKDSKTILLIHGIKNPLPPEIIKYALDGIIHILPDGTPFGKHSNYSDYVFRNIGCIVIDIENNFFSGQYYLENKFAKVNVKIDKNDLEKILGWNLNIIQNIF
ncbi:hypothetical protein A2533_04805 [Candidatus Falkowbacteria bacterium RIFOXYD2_FULL_35_9]|uniref:Uncharacterized protein n=1 Tax=Candidatus Falkowbacteria bacterium RIFOXYC2_FULL_36_12 TaxID=1798002 RepID=A0A1F5SYA8_9BACT|nr:MAG: hypothetical protein A2478_04370 [Candidatus Falkowbacteria bacterium RIFOXYC2_FULL_36_12]OGF33180.1 MAG: hypothetical protein A2223_04925 [Candidatus Falkowbacteria bacterium RIFOXYA2_FULL_35_8]OGF46174.1 MAG: hypothetical protein A2533_04805 [Candidatus Falkowbacteria bacterium RIFOXYD2_FULL_35_9]